MPRSKGTARFSKRPVRLEDDPSYRGHALSKKQRTIGVAAGRAESNAGATPNAQMDAAFAKQAESFLCPLSLELPDDPVYAEDFQIYDRKSVQAWFDSESGAMVKSPVTREWMGKTLKPAPHVRDLFDNFIVPGLWKCERAQAWLKRLNEKKEREAKVKELQEGAANGDPKKMYEFAVALRHGKHGLTIDIPSAYKWYEKAAEAGHHGACATYGLCLMNGINLPKNERMGLAYLQSSALLGSEAGCFEIGLLYQQGAYGYPKDEEKAHMWYRRMATCGHRDAGDDRRRRAENSLNTVMIEDDDDEEYVVIEDDDDEEQ